ncbi:Palmitoyltransferase ZDHHC15 (Acyltransferase ZDHHC15) (Zinc finger DHHC domain-containing protein 15) (DHHC-15) [Durusdinium trenchii]|uniref:Palmitoyltransferase n=1 Tax=Durusdinium trenchii TaxID=1381693 RepID=A0ABP0SHB0_9DINO
MCEPIPESLHLTRGYTKLELTEAGVDQFSAAGRSGDDGGVRAHSCGRGSVQPTGEDYDPRDPSLTLQPHEHVMSCLDSLSTVAVRMGMVEQFPNLRNNYSLLFDYPTMECLARALYEGDDQLERLQKSDVPPMKPAPWAEPVATLEPELKPELQPFTQLTELKAKSWSDALYSETLIEERFVRQSDGMECILIPSADVHIGGGTAEAARCNEQPTHPVRLKSFLMDIEPVSVGAYVRFLNLASPPPTEAQLLDWCLLPLSDRRNLHVPVARYGNRWEVKEGVPVNWPMILVSWYGANAYSLWAHGKDWHDYKTATAGFLPSEAQWEYAARGETPRSFPWGDKADPELLNVCWEATLHADEALNSKPLRELPLKAVNLRMGHNPFGLRGMAGNVWQWCRDTYDPDFYCTPQARLPDAWNDGAGIRRSERGGSWVGGAHMARSSYRRGRCPEAKGRCLGFRCCAPPALLDASTTTGDASSHTSTDPALRTLPITARDAEARPLVQSDGPAAPGPEESKDETWDCSITTSSSMFFQMTMSVTLGVFIYEGTAYNLMFLGRVLPSVGKADFVPFFFLLFNAIWGMALVAYIRSFATGPGKVPFSWHEFVREVGPALPVVPSTARWAPGKATFCRKCSIPRPERAHHCNVSGFCVLRMDHYCPWINNCVGLGNYKFFLQLVIYGSFASFVGIATSLPEFVLCVGKICGFESDAWKEDLQITDMVAFLMFEGLAIFLCVLLVPMLCTHVPLACNNMTAIEGNYSNMSNPYDLGSKMANLEQILGSFGPDWFFPVKPFDPKGDGVSFPRWDEPMGPDQRPLADEEVLQGDQLWRVRYQVRAPVRPNPQEQEFDPLRTLTQWFNGVDQDPHDLTSPVSHQMGCVN